MRLVGNLLATILSSDRKGFRGELTVILIVLRRRPKKKTTPSCCRQCGLNRNYLGDAMLIPYHI